MVLREVLIDSIDGRSLRFWNKQAQDADQIWAYDVTATLETGVITERVWDAGLGLATFFRQLAEEEPRFEGVREFGTLEGELLIDARAEGLGHVRIDVTLNHHVPPTASLSVSLTLGAGAHVTRIAGELQQFCDTT